MNMLVAFIQSGTWDVSPVIDADKMVSGDAQRGQALYGGVCVQCHGADGKALNFGDESEPEYVGTIALDNPWEAIHKIASGQPGTPMPAGRNFGWTLQDIADLAGLPPASYHCESMGVESNRGSRKSLLPRRPIMGFTALPW